MILRSTSQLGLLEWTPPSPVARFDEDRVRASSVAERISRAVAAALKDSGEDREVIAARMSEFLGAKVSRHMLDSYASQAREDHAISIVRFVALLHATGDRRLLEVLAQMFDWAVVERRYLKMIDLAAMQEREDEMRRQRKNLAAECKREGLL
jgi:hypothetical protein